MLAGGRHARYGPLEKRTAEGITGLNLRAARDPRPVQALSICMLPISGLPLLVSPLGECGCRLDPVISVHQHDPGAGADVDPAAGWPPRNSPTWNVWTPSSRR